MAKTNWQNPGTSEIISPTIAGVQEAIGKVESILDVKVLAVTNEPLSEVFISDSDRYRIYEVGAGKRNWVGNPAPVIKKNGVTISSGFTIEYGGGAVVFNPSLVSTDVITADFSYVAGGGTIQTSTTAEADAMTSNALTGTAKADTATWCGMCIYKATTTGTVPITDIVFDNLRFGKYVVGVRIRTSNNAATNQVTINVNPATGASTYGSALGTSSFALTTLPASNAYKVVYVPFEYATTKAYLNRIKISISVGGVGTAGVEVAIDSISIEPIHPAVYL